MHVQNQQKQKKSKTKQKKTKKTKTITGLLNSAGQKYSVWKRLLVKLSYDNSNLYGCKYKV